jgi:integrase
MVSLYSRGKNEAGQWRYTRIKEGRGMRTGNIAGPFYTRYSGINKKGKKGQLWHQLSATTFNEAKTEAAQLDTALEARARGLTVTELDNLTNQNRTPIRSAVDIYLEQKSTKAPKTVAAYTHYHYLNEFIQAVKIRFMDEITENVLRSYKKFLEQQGYAGKTIDTRLNIVFFLLKKNGITARLPRDEMPTIEEEVAVAYTAQELKAVFAAMNPEKEIRYRFFLGTACRDQEVTYAAWQDIDFTKRTYHHACPN